MTKDQSVVVEHELAIDLSELQSDISLSLNDNLENQMFHCITQT